MEGQGSKGEDKTKSRLIDGAAFVLGAGLAFLQVGVAEDFPWPIKFAITILCPGLYLSTPLVYLIGAIGLASISFYFVLMVVVNGLLYGLTSYLIRNSLKGRLVARRIVRYGAAVWIVWGVWWTFMAWPWPEPPPAPVNLASPLAGRWNGILHAPRGDRVMILVCHPRVDSTLDGYLYVHGWDMGPLETGTWAKNSLHFEIIGTEYSAHFDRKTMGMEVSGMGRGDIAELHFASADTARPVPGPVDLTSPLAGRWVGMLNVANGTRSAILICHPHVDSVLDGYLYIDGRDMGPFEGGLWAADSLSFEIEGFEYSAHFDRTNMAVARLGRNMNQTMTFRYTGGDTTRPYGLPHQPR